MFCARMVQNPNDSIIYGRAIGFAYVIDRDDATPADIALRNWKKKLAALISGLGDRSL